MELVRFFLKEEKLFFKDELAEKIFYSHLEELKKRDLKSQELSIEIGKNTYNTIDKNLIEKAEKIIDLLGIKNLTKKREEKYLIATHLIIMKEER